MKEVKYNFPAVSRHVYDIDAFEILDQLRKNYECKKESIKPDYDYLASIDDQEDHFMKVMKSEDRDLTMHQEHRNYIVSSSLNFYNYFLSQKLLIIDIHKIGALLSFQAKKFLGNPTAKRDNFIGLIEFKVYESVKVGNIFSEDIRLEKIMNWVDKNRRISSVDFTEENLTLDEDDVLRKVPTFREVAYEEDFSITLVNALKPFFAEEEHELLLRLIIDGVYEKSIVFKAKQNQIVELFKRLKKASKLVVSNNKVLAEWITKCFLMLDKDEQPRALNYNSVIDILNKSRNEPKWDWILEDLLPPKQKD
jgi:hypothetical protein